MDRQGMRIDDLISRRGAWLPRGKAVGVAISSRVRLARNVRGERFPSWADDAARHRVWTRLREVLTGLPLLDNPMCLHMEDLDWTDKQVLRERHIISVEMSEMGRGSGVAVREDESVSVMVNEEDHLRIQAMAPGMCLKEVWKTVDRLDSELEKHVHYAFSKRLGYLTSCPTNVGTGLRASVMLHLPALGLMNEIDPMIKGLTRIGLAVRGLLGEGTEASGNMFQVSNQTSLGESEEAILDRLVGIVAELETHERNARTRLLEERETQLMDYVGRSVGVLTSAELMPSQELLDLLSGVWIGLETGLVRNVTLARIHELMLLTQPGHMQKLMGKELSPEDRDAARAGMVRQRMKNVVVVR